VGSTQILRGLVFSPSCSAGAFSPLRLSASPQLQKVSALIVPCNKCGFITPNSTTLHQKGSTKKATIFWRLNSTKIKTPAQLPNRGGTWTALETADSPPASTPFLEETSGEALGHLLILLRGPKKPADDEKEAVF